MDKNYISSTLPKTSAEVDILLLVYILLLVQINLVLFHFITDHMAPYDVYKTKNLVYEDLVYPEWLPVSSNP